MASLSYRTNLESSSNATSYTFSGTDIGTAASDRLVVVGSVAAAASGGANVTSLTVGGSAATFDVRASSGHTSELWHRAVTTGTTASIVVNYSANMVSCGIAVWALYGVNATPFDTATTTTSSTQIDIPAGGIVVGNARIDPGSTTWTGATEDFENTTLGDALAGYSGASRQAVSAETNTTISVSATNGYIAAASWESSAAVVGISGSTSLTFAPSGTIRGRIPVAGSTSLTFTTSGAAAGKNRIAGSTSLSFATAGDIRGKGALAGASFLSFTPSATIRGKGAVVGSTSLTFATSGTLRAPARIIGATSLSFTTTGNAAGKARIAGNTLLSFTLSGFVYVDNGPGKGRASASRPFAQTGVTAPSGQAIVTAAGGRTGVSAPRGRASASRASGRATVQ